VAALTNGETLIRTFRRAVSRPAWRWPILVLVVLLVIHLFLPDQLTKYDPLDRLYRRIETKKPHKAPPPGPRGTGAQP
jgi:hypothetical protein